MTTAYKIAIALALVCVWLVAFGGASKEDIAACMEATNYSEARCVHEINQ